MVFDGVCVAPRPADAEESAWYGMPRHFSNLFVMERWPPAYRAWGAGLVKDVTEMKRIPEVDGDRIFRVVTALDALHQEARRSLDRMFDNASRREAGHGFMETGRQAAIVRQYMTDMIDEAATHEIASTSWPGMVWPLPGHAGRGAAPRAAPRRGPRRGQCPPSPPRPRACTASCARWPRACAAWGTFCRISSA